jgi:hypothetical protein
MQRFSQWMMAGATALLLCAGVTLPVVAQQSQEKIILATTFEKDANGWMAFGDKTMVVLDTDTVSGTKSLRYDYRVEKGGLGILVLPVNENEITAAKSLRFKVKTDYPTALAIAMQEGGNGNDGPRYVATFTVQGGEWQEVALGVSDFVLTQGKDDPKDPNGKLDMNQIANIGIFDFKQIFAQGDDSPLTDLIGLKRGAHQLWLKDFRLTAEVLPGAAFVTPSDPRLDTFGHPQVGWAGLGSMKLSIHTGSPIEARGLKAVYSHGPGKIAALVRSLPKGRLQDTSGIQITLASQLPTTVVVQLEETSGGKYNAVLEVPGGNMPKEFDISYSQFTPSEDSKDDNNSLNTGSVHQFLLLDISGMLGSAKEVSTNTLYVTNFRVKK